MLAVFLFQLAQFILPNIYWWFAVRHSFFELAFGQIKTSEVTFMLLLELLPTFFEFENIEFFLEGF